MITLSLNGSDEYSVSKSLVILFVVFLLIIPAIGYYYYSNQKLSFKKDTQKNLTTIGEAKIGEIVQWRKERLGNAYALYNNISFAEHIKEYLADPSDTKTRKRIQNWMARIQVAHEYDQVSFTDRTNTQLMYASDVSDSVSTISRARAKEATQSRTIIFQDFYRHSVTGKVYLKIFIPILDPSDSLRVLGTVSLRIDPERYLYPLLQRWSIISRTSESLLVRRDGDTVVYLNNVRFQPSSALTMRLPLSRDSVAAVKAVRGFRGATEAIDYRGVPIVAYVNAIPNSPWFLVVRIDADEVYEPLLDRLWLTIAFVMMLVAGTSLGFGMVWRDQRSRFYEQLYRTNEKLKQSDQRFKNVFDHSPIGKSLTTIQGQVTPNKAFCSMLGYTMEEMNSIPWEMITHPDDFASGKKEVHATLNDEQESFRLVKRYLRKDDSVVWADVSTFLQRDSNGSPMYFITAIIDITKQKAAEAEIVKLNSELELRIQRRTLQLETANKELEAFAYSISHDLRAPLRAIDGFAQAIQEDYSPVLDAEALRLFSIIRTNAQRMDDLITDILALSRASRTEFRRSSVDMTAMANAVYREIATPKQQEEFTFILDPLCTAEADPTLIRQVWVNLISNALKYTQPKTVKQIHVSCTVKAGMIEYGVSDTGVGFNPEYSGKLFGLFQRLHSSRDFEGNGVGLAIVQRIIHRHGGTVRADAVLNEGTALYFSLPIQEVEHEQSASRNPAR